MNYGNRLRNAVGQEGSYAYDAYGRRIQQVTTSGVINSFYDHTGQLVYQQSRDGTTHDYLYLQGHLVAIRDYNTSGAATAMRYQHTDAQGSVLQQSDRNGNPLPGTYMLYDAYGKPISPGGQASDAPGYTGHVMDASTGLTYMQQRYYDPDAMHFLSMDPVEANNAGGNLDRYWYANDNPYRFTDPDGRMADQDQEKSPCTGSLTGNCGGEDLKVTIVDDSYRRGADTGARGRQQTASRGANLSPAQMKSAQKSGYESLIKTGTGIQMTGAAWMIGGYTAKGLGLVIAGGEDVAGGGPVEPAGDVAAAATYRAISKAADTYALRPGASLLATGGAMSAGGALGLASLGYRRDALNTWIESITLDPRTGPLAPYLDEKVMNPYLNRIEDWSGMPADKQ